METSFRVAICCLAAAAAVLPAMTVRAARGPDAAMMQPVNALRRAMERFDEPALPPVFSSRRVTIVENFAPYVFEGTDVTERWWREFRAHAASGKLTDLQATFGAAQDYEHSGDRVFFTLPTRWTGSAAGHRFVERGGWAFVLVRESGTWRIRSYAWAVTATAVAP